MMVKEWLGYFKDIGRFCHPGRTAKRETRDLPPFYLFDEGPGSRLWRVRDDTLGYADFLSICALTCAFNGRKISGNFDGAVANKYASKPPLWSMVRRNLYR